MYKTTMHADSSHVEIRLFNTSRQDKVAHLTRINLLYYMIANYLVLIFQL